MEVTFTTPHQQFHAKLVGVSHQNPDGSSRQKLIAACRPGEAVELRREPDNPYDRCAVAVFNQRGAMLGYLPKGDLRLASHMDRGGQIWANIAQITGGPSWFQMLIGRAGKSYGCVLKITKGDFDWSAIAPWQEADQAINKLLRAAEEWEKDKPELAIAHYREAIEKLMALDANGAQASAWRTEKYPIQRLSLVLDRAGRKAEAIEEIARWEGYADPVGIPDRERDAVLKRKARLQRALR